MQIVTTGMIGSPSSEREQGRKDRPRRIAKAGWVYREVSFNGTIYNDSSVRIAMVTDGTSNTFMFAEHSKSMATLNDPNYFVSDMSWQSARWYDTLFATLYPMTTNLQGNSVQANGPYGYYAITIASSLHPGGATSPSATGRCGSSRTRSLLGRSTLGKRIRAAMPSPITRTYHK